MNLVVGVDEAGRGALAGPVCVGAVLCPSDFEWREVFSLVTRGGKPRLRDSKQLSAKQRGIVYDYIISHQHLVCASAFVNAPIIDAKGIVQATHRAAALALSRLNISPHRVDVLLDGGLRAPSKWQQRAYVRGDETIPAVALASIIAKVSRDRAMEKLSVRYAPYRFGMHKGYGTPAHRYAISRAGLSEIHRASFCTKLRIGLKPV